MAAKQPLLLIIFLAYAIRLFFLWLSSSSSYKRAERKLNATVVFLGGLFVNIVQILSYMGLYVMIASMLSFCKKWVCS